jgi:hypothetical protein
MTVQIGDVVIAIKPTAHGAEVCRGWLVGRADSRKWIADGMIESTSYTVRASDEEGTEFEVTVPQVAELDGSTAPLVAGCPDIPRNPFAGRVLVHNGFDAPVLDGAPLRKRDEIVCDDARLRVDNVNYEWSFLDVKTGVYWTPDELASRKWERAPKAGVVTAPQDVA